MKTFKQIKKEADRLEDRLRQLRVAIAVMSGLALYDEKAAKNITGRKPMSAAARKALGKKIKAAFARKRAEAAKKAKDKSGKKATPTSKSQLAAKAVAA